MTSPNWQEVKDIFDLALQQKPEDRLNYIKKVCANDTTLQNEVESLLSSLEKAPDFMETPAIEQITDANEYDDQKLGIKEKTFGRYKIIKQIGAGGMGEVYLAEDTQLDRKVAIKVLNQKFAAHESNLQRFIREAKSASALNHPNILVIHEIGEDNGIHFIVSEYVEGNTLREIIKEKSLQLKEVLDISIQVANALSAAHLAKIIHRDIKPENVIVRPDGYVKILDFGLAKLLEQKTAGFEDETVQQNQTASGIILGTVNYMSPEQAKGEKVDERTDIFSFGIMLYEMIAGRTPFAANSMSETFANLINKEPLPPSHFVPNLPPELERIVFRTLIKNKDERYQTMNDLLSDLHQGQNGFKAQANLVGFSSSDNKESAVTEILEADPKENGQSFRRKLSHKIFIFIGLASLLLTLMGLGYWWFSTRGLDAKSTEPTAIDSPKPFSKLYWQMTEAEQLSFTKERARHIEELMGDEQTELDEESLKAIKAEIDNYIERKDSLSQKQYEEGLRVVYGRGSQYAPIIIQAYEARKLPPVVGLYQAMVESEYHDCPTSEHPDTSVGLFGFSRTTAGKYGLTPKDYCSVEKQSDAAAKYMSDLTSDFVDEKSSATLGLMAFNCGEDRVRKYLRQLRERGITERSFWALLRNRQNLKPPLTEEWQSYTPRFFAAAIIGETPEVFALPIQRLTTLREK